MKVIKPQLVKIKNPDTGEFENLNGYVKDQETIIVDQELINTNSENPISSKAVYNYTERKATYPIDYIYNLLCDVKENYHMVYNTSTDNNLYKSADNKYIYYDGQTKYYNTDKSIVSIKINIYNIFHINFSSNNLRCPYVITDKNENVIKDVLDQTIAKGTKSNNSYDYYNDGSGYYLIINIIPNDDCIIWYNKTVNEKVKKEDLDNLSKNISKINENIDNNIELKIQKIISDYYNFYNSIIVKKISNGYYYENGVKVSNDNNSNLDSYTVDISNCLYIEFMYNYKYPFVIINKDGDVSYIEINESSSKDHLSIQRRYFKDSNDKYIVINYYKDTQYPLDTKIYNVIEPLITGDDITNIKSIPDLKKSVSDGKVLLAGAITNKGVNTASTDTFETMANNINNISSNISKEYKYSTASDGPAITCNPCEDILIEVSCEYASKSE